MGGCENHWFDGVEPQVRSTCPWWTPQPWCVPALPPSSTVVSLTGASLVIFWIQQKANSKNLLQEYSIWGEIELFKLICLIFPAGQRGGGNSTLLECLNFLELCILQAWPKIAFLDLCNWSLGSDSLKKYSDYLVQTWTILSPTIWIFLNNLEFLQFYFLHLASQELIKTPPVEPVQGVVE